MNQALENGRITEAQAEELKSRIESGEAPWLFGPGFFGFRGHAAPAGRGLGPDHFLLFLHDKLTPAAEYLGLTEERAARAAP